MKKEQQKKILKAEIPQGCFHGNDNCSDCIYWERNNRDSNDRGYCNHYGSYYHPSERQGCGWYEER